MLWRLPVQEGVSKGVEFPEGLLGVHDQGVARDDTLILPVHDGDEAIGGWLWANPHAREVLLQEIPTRSTKGQVSAKYH